MKKLPARSQTPAGRTPTGTRPALPRPGPRVVDLPPGIHLCCNCGRSQRFPLCDGSHAGSGIEPLAFRVDASAGLLWLCTCGRSRERPYCDGRSHNLPA